MPQKVEEMVSSMKKELLGKTNPKTNKPYTEDDIWAIAQAQYKKMQEKEYKISRYGKFEFKEDKEEFYSEGYVATTHPDRAKEGRRKGDILTKNAVKSIVEQINNREGLMADLTSYRHDWIKEGDASMPAVGRAVQAEFRDLPNGHFGAFVKTHHNKVHPHFTDIKYEVEKGYLPGYSIEYVAKESQPVKLPDGEYRMIDNLDLKGYGLASGRLVANPMAVIESFGYKEIMDAVQESKEVHTMTEENKTPPLESKETVAPKLEIDAKEYDRYQKFIQMEIKEKKDAEIKEIIKKELAGLMPEVKVKYNGINLKEVESSVECKEWKEINDDKISVKEAFNRATAYAHKTGAFDNAARNFRLGMPIFGGLTDYEFKCTGIDNARIEIKALTTTSNQAADTDYYQSAAELSDIYAPAITKMLNQRTTFFGLLPKVDYSGKSLIEWRAENVANSTAAAYLEGDAITKGITTRQKLLEHFKYYKVGIQVTGQMIESARSGIGDVFQAEIEAATRQLLSTMNSGLFAEVGAFTSAGFLGLEYIADSTGNTTLYGLTRSTTNLLGASGSEYAAQSSAPISKATLRTGLRTLETNGADRSSLVFVCHPLQRDMVLALLDDAQRFNSVSARAGFEGQPSFDGVPIFTDKDANNDDIFICNLGANGLRMGVQVPVRFEELAKTDDSRSGFLKFYGNQYAEAPKQALYMIQGLATS